MVQSGSWRSEAGKVGRGVSLFPEGHGCARRAWPGVSLIIFGRSGGPVAVNLFYWSSVCLGAFLDRDSRQPVCLVETSQVRDALDSSVAVLARRSTSLSIRVDGVLTPWANEVEKKLLPPPKCEVNIGDGPKDLAEILCWPDRGLDVLHGASLLGPLGAILQVCFCVFLNLHSQPFGAASL